MYRYAQIDENGIVICESFLSGEVIADNMILLTDEQIELGRIKYVDGEFVPYEPQQEQPNQINYDNAINALAQYEQSIIDELEGVINE